MVDSTDPPKFIKWSMRTSGLGYGALNLGRSKY